MNRQAPLPPAVAEIFASILDRYSAVLPTLERNAPRLSDAEVEEISERVAEKLMTEFMQMAPSASSPWWKAGFQASRSAGEKCLTNR